MFKHTNKIKLITVLFVHLFNISTLHAHQFSVEKDKDVVNAIKEVFGSDFPDLFKPLLGGFSSPGVYKISINGSSYALRLSNKKRAYIDQQRTINCMRIGAEEDLAPKIFYANEKDGIFITKFIDSKHLSLNKKSQKNVLVDLALTVRKLHNGKSFPEFLSIFSVRKKFEHSITTYKSYIINAVSRELSKIEAILTKHNISKPTHNDLKPENIIFDGKKFWFVDWEAACQGDPYFDIATIIIFYELDPNHENLFLKTYFGENPTRFQKLRLYLMKQVVLGYYGAAYLMVSKYKNVTPLSHAEIEKLPKLHKFLNNKLSKKILLESYQDVQRFGWILLKEVYRNVNSLEFKNIYSEMLITAYTHS